MKKNNQASTPPSDPPKPYTHSRAEREHYAGELLRLEYETKLGKLGNTEVVAKNVFELARQARDRVMQIPRRLAPIICAEIDVQPNPKEFIQEILEKALLEAMEGADKYPE